MKKYKLYPEESKKKRNFSRLVGETIVPVVLVASMIGSIYVSAEYKAKKQIEIERDTLIEYFGEASIESKLLNHLEILMKLKELNLDKYNISLYDLGTSEDIKLESINIINSAIEEYKSLSHYDSNDLKTNLNFIKKVAFLKQQQYLAEGFIKSNEMLVYYDLKDSLNSYIGEKYNIPDTENLDAYNYTKNGIRDYRVCYNEFECTDNSKEIRKGVDTIDRYSKIKKDDLSLEKLYNTYVEYLIKAKGLYEVVDSSNLYNSVAENNLKK